MKRILILTADAGLGHRSAANTIAGALREGRGSSCRVEIVNPLGDERVPAVVRDLVRDLKPDVVVTTYPLYQAPLRAVKAIEGLGVPLVTVITDLVTIHRMWFSQAADLCLVPTESARDAALEYGLSRQSVEVCGISVDPEIAREERDRATIRADLGWEQDLATYLVVGGKRVGHLGDILRVLNHSGLPVQLWPVVCRFS